MLGEAAACQRVCAVREWMGQGEAWMGVWVTGVAVCEGKWRRRLAGGQTAGLIQ